MNVIYLGTQFSGHPSEVFFSISFWELGQFFSSSTLIYPFYSPVPRHQQCSCSSLGGEKWPEGQLLQLG